MSRSRLLYRGQLLSSTLTPKYNKLVGLKQNYKGKYMLHIEPHISLNIIRRKEIKIENEI